MYPTRKNMYTIERLDAGERTFIIMLACNNSKVAKQHRTGKGVWHWSGSEHLNMIETEKFLITNNLICPDCKTDLDERGRCLKQCSKNVDKFINI